MVILIRLNALRFTGSVVYFTLETFGLIFKGKIRFRTIIREMYELGVQAFPIISDGKVAGIVGLFNSQIFGEDAEIIAETCRVAGFIIRIMSKDS